MLHEPRIAARFHGRIRDCLRGALALLLGVLFIGVGQVVGATQPGGAQSGSIPTGAAQHHAGPRGPSQSGARQPDTAHGGSSRVGATRADVSDADASQADVSQTATPSAPRVALVTFGPGRLYWERFGHDAILVNDPDADEPTVYNYGVFDFQQKNFLLNFARGHMQYRLMGEPLETDLETYAVEGRSVTVQMLNLTPEQASRLAAFLAWNALPENSRYQYDYFINNCSTKVRDALNEVLGGALQQQLSRRPAQHTYRFDSIRLVSPDFWLALGMDAGFGPRADRPLNLWQESFAPEVLSLAVRSVVVPDPHGGTRPLVSDEEVVLAARLPLPPAAPPEHRWPFLAVGIALATLLFWLGSGNGRFHRASFALLAGAWWLLCGVSGLTFAALWGLTQHWAAWGNQNLLLFNPLCLVLPVSWWYAPRGARYLAILIALGALLSPIIRMLPGLYESNLPFIALAVPVHVSLAVLAWRQRLAHGVAVRGDSRLACD